MDARRGSNRNSPKASLHYNSRERRRGPGGERGGGKGATTRRRRRLYPKNLMASGAHLVSLRNYEEIGPQTIKTWSNLRPPSVLASWVTSAAPSTATHPRESAADCGRSPSSRQPGDVSVRHPEGASHPRPGLTSHKARIKTKNGLPPGSRPESGQNLRFQRKVIVRTLPRDPPGKRGQDQNLILP